MPLQDDFVAPVKRITGHPQQVTRDAGRGVGEVKSLLSPGTLPAVKMADWK